jgi:hypothetical protein
LSPTQRPPRQRYQKRRMSPASRLPRPAQKQFWGRCQLHSRNLDRH